MCAAFGLFRVTLFHNDHHGSRHRAKKPTQWLKPTFIFLDFFREQKKMREKTTSSRFPFYLCISNLSVCECSAWVCRCSLPRNIFFLGLLAPLETFQEDVSPEWMIPFVYILPWSLIRMGVCMCGAESCEIFTIFYNETFHSPDSFLLHTHREIKRYTKGSIFLFREKYVSHVMAHTALQ